MINEYRVGDVLNKSLSVLLANFIPFMIITTAVNLPSIVFAIYTGQNPEESNNLILTLLQLFLGPIATGAITFGVFQQLRGKHSSMGECVSVGFSRLFPVMFVAIVTGIAIMLGTLLLIVPGIILACMLFVAVPSAVVEKNGVRGALARSRELTRGSRFNIFWVVLLLGLIDSGFSIFFDRGLPAMGAPREITLPVTFFFQFMISSWQSTAAAISYYYFRSMKESVDVDEIAAVFD